MNKRGQLGNVAAVILIIMVTPFVLVWFSPVLEAAALTSLDKEDGIVAQFILIAFKPILWFMYFILSVIVIGSLFIRGASS